MLMTEFQEFLTSERGKNCGYTKEEHQFDIFYQHHTAGKGWILNLCELAYQIMQLQVCVEGLIEDQEKR